jgi:hypothetical protein
VIEDEKPLARAHELKLVHEGFVVKTIQQYLNTMASLLQKLN